MLWDLGKVAGCHVNGALCTQQAAEELGIKAYSFDEFLAMGRSKPADAIPPTLDDLCTIMYTSGTTGMPKVRWRREYFPYYSRFFHPSKLEHSSRFLGLSTHSFGLAVHNS